MADVHTTNGQQPPLSRMLCFAWIFPRRTISVRDRNCCLTSEATTERSPRSEHDDQVVGCRSLRATGTNHSTHSSRRAARSGVYSSSVSDVALYITCQAVLGTHGGVEVILAAEWCNLIRSSPCAWDHQHFLPSQVIRYCPIQPWPGRCSADEQTLNAVILSDRMR